MSHSQSTPADTLIDAQAERSGVLILRPFHPGTARILLIIGVIAAAAMMTVILVGLHGRTDLEAVLGRTGSLAFYLVLSLTPLALTSAYLRRTWTRFDAQGIHSSSLLDTQHTPWPAQRSALTVKARRSSRLPGKRQERESWIVVISGPNGPVTLSAPQGAAPRGRRTPPAALTRSLDQIWDWAGRHGYIPR